MDEINKKKKKIDDESIYYFLISRLYLGLLHDEKEGDDDDTDGCLYDADGNILYDIEGNVLIPKE